MAWQDIRNKANQGTNSQKLNKALDILRDAGQITGDTVQGLLDFIGIGTPLAKKLDKWLGISKSNSDKLLKIVRQATDREGKISDLQDLVNRLDVAANLVGGNTAIKVGQRAKQAKNKLNKARTADTALRTIEAQQSAALETNPTIGDIVSFRNPSDENSIKGGNFDASHEKFSKEFEQYVR